MSSQTFSLIVSIPGQDPTQHELAAGKSTLGRGPDNTIQVLVAEVSVSHAVIEVGDESTTIADVGSTNGTQVNGKSVSAEPIALNPMDKLLLGNTIPAYFVPTAVAANGSLAELVESLEKDAKEQSAPVAVAVSEGTPAAPVKPGLPAVAKPGAPAPIKPAAPAAGGAPAAPLKPAPVAPAKPAPVAPAAAGASTVKLAQVKPTAPGAGGPAQPAAPKLGAPAAPVAPAAPAAPAAGPAAPKPAPIPLKKPAPAAPKIPLPGKKPDA